MPKIRFFTASVTKDKNSLVPVYVRVQSGKQIDIVCKTGEITRRDSWKNSNKNPTKDSALIKKLAGLRSSIEKALMNTDESDLVEMLGKRPDIGKDKRSRERNKKLILWLQTVVDKHRHPEKYEETLFSFMKEFIEKAKSKPNIKTGHPVGIQMQSDYKTVFDNLKEFAESKNRVIDFKDIDLDFFHEFIEYLQGKKLSANTIKKKITVLKVFLNNAKDEGKNPYEAYKSKRFSAKGEDSESVYLNKDELTKIFNLNLSKRQELEPVRDLFLVACWTGCRFTDVGQITPESIYDGMIHLTQHKTGTKVVIPLHPVVASILNKYHGELPIETDNNKFNTALQSIAELAGINEKCHKAMTRGGTKTSKAYKKFELVTAHAARRSFATNLFLSGFPSLSIMKITGHRTEESFLRYIKVTPQEHAEKLQLHWNISNLKAV